jgi:hypothetical protein
MRKTEAEERNDWRSGPGHCSATRFLALLPLQCAVMVSRACPKSFFVVGRRGHESDFVGFCDRSEAPYGRVAQVRYRLFSTSEAHPNDRKMAKFEWYFPARNGRRTTIASWATRPYLVSYIFGTDSSQPRASVLPRVTDHAGSRTACVRSTGEFSLLARLASAIVYIVWQRRKTRPYRFALRPRKSGVWRPTLSARGFLLAL